MLSSESFALPTEISLIIICAGISVGVALASTIFWAKTGWQITFRFFRTLVLASAVISIPFWYPQAAVLVQTFISGLSS